LRVNLQLADQNVLDLFFYFLFSFHGRSLTCLMDLIALS
jgi:hypothetical protein